MGIVYAVVPLSGLLISYYKINDLTTLLKQAAEAEKVN
jgi:TRAP-type C4-dicarboxylate transport system permease small subunit